MLVAEDSSSKRCMAWLTQKDQGPFFCPECGDEVILRKGSIREHHFAHRPPVNCAYGEGESELHLRAKREIYQSLVNYEACAKCEIERALRGVRPDVSLRIRGTPVAIEIQRSTIDVRMIRQRTESYTKLGIFLLWMIPESHPTSSYDADINSEVHRFKEWEAYLHAMYFGRLYYWQGGAHVRAVHFDPFERYVEETEWYEPGGELRMEGGYYRTPKRLRKLAPFEGGLFHLADDFYPKKKTDASRVGNITIPPCSIWRDTKRKWW